MPQKTFDLEVNLPKDSLARNISAKWLTWLEARAEWEERYRRTLQYLYSTTTDTIYGQASQPWSANVHIPKLTQLRDVLITYELESLFSLRDFFDFEGFTKDANTMHNRDLIKNLLRDILEKGGFKQKMERLLEDYVDAGNSFAMPVWKEEYAEKEGYKTLIFEGSEVCRINPLDIVFDPTTVSFYDSPKIIRTVLSLGEVALMAKTDPVMKKGFERAMKNRREVLSAMTNGDTIKGDQLEIAGFGNLSAYLTSDVVELLTFYGTLYDVDKDELHENVKITIMDRSCVLKEEPMSSEDRLGLIQKAGYRDRKDTLWSMSPLENLLGMQARIDFLENKRSDCYDASVNPVKLIKGNVDMPDALGPGDEIRTDLDSDVRYLTPDTSILSADTLINNYEAKMEELIGSPKEVLGFRTPGEKTMFEVNQLFTAATRQFHRQIEKFEREMVEPLLNKMLQQYLNAKAGQTIQIRVWNSEKNFYAFEEVSVDAINSLGRIKVVGSSTYQEKQQIAQALQMLGQNPLFMDSAVLNNFSPMELGLIFNYVSGMDKFPDLFKKDQRLYEITDQQKLVERLSQQVDQEKAEGLARISEEANASAIQLNLAQQRQGMTNATEEQ